MFARTAVSRVFSVLLVVVLVLAGVLPSRTAAASPRKTRGLPSGLSAADWAQVKALLPAAAPDTIDYLKASNTGATDSFGYCVSLSGDTLVVGSPYEASNAVGVNGDEANNSAWSAGAAYVFTRSGTTWSQQAYLKASNTALGDLFGYAVSVSGDTIVVGAYGEDSNATGVNGDEANNLASAAGAAYVFTRSGTTWSQQAYLKASSTEASDWFGWVVSVSGDTLAVGALSEDSNATGVNGDEANNSAVSSGAAYVFTRSGTTWSQQAYLKASNTGAFDNFGYALSLSGDTLSVGAPYEASNATGVNGNEANNSAGASGAAYVFTRSGTTWSQQAYVKASNTEASDEFGYAVSLSGDTLVVGAWGEDSNATGVNGNDADNSALTSGAAYVFTRSGTTWSQQAYVKASNTGASDRFGWAVALSGDTLMVGAPYEGSNATGVNGDQTDNSAARAGAAYLLARSGTTWSQQAYLKASNTEFSDEFGSAISLSGDTLVVGAYNEDSNATGVNGNAANNSASASGAAYAYSGTPPTVLSSVRVDANPTSAASVDFTVTFSKSVTGVDASDFALTTSGVVGASVTGVSGGPTAYAVTINTGTGDGTIRLDVTDDDTILDTASNPLGGAGAGNGNFTTGEVYTVSKPTCVAPAVTTQPQSQMVVTGQSAVLTVAASGTAPLGYQWYQGASGDTSGPIAGAIAASYATPALTATGQYWVRVTNACGQADSATATVTVTAGCVAPSITTQPQSQTIASGYATTLSVTADGTSLAYRWYQGDSPDTSTLLADGPSNMYTTPALTATTHFWVQVYNACGQSNSETAAITVGGCTSCPTITVIKSKTSKPRGKATLWGTGFSTDKKKDVVYFGAKKAKISKAKTTSIQVKIPKDAKGTVQVYVIVNGEESNRVNFTVK